MSGDTEKITVNLSVVDLGKIDLLVDEGAYAGRTDFVRSAIRAQLDKQVDEIVPAVARGAFVVGALTFDASTLRAYSRRQETLAIRAIGLVVIAEDVTPELALETIESIRVRGGLRMPAAVRDALRDRIR